MRWTFVCLIFAFLGQLSCTDAGSVECPPSKIIKTTKSNGDQVEFQCKFSHNFPLNWYFTPKNSNQEKLLFSGYAMALSGYDVNRANYGLKFTATKETDGTYSCEEPGTLSRCSVILSIEDTPTTGKQISPSKASSAFGGIGAGDALCFLVLCFIGAEF